MKQITEDYCNFETATLLKEKGFNCACEYQYINCSSEYPFLTDIRDDAGCYYKNSEIGEDEYSAPTLQMALKWLREVHNIFIDIMTYTTGSKIQFRWVGYDKGRLFSQEEGKIIYFDTHEKAVEAALLYVLKNLI